MKYGDFRATISADAGAVGGKGKRREEKSGCSRGGGERASNDFGNRSVVAGDRLWGHPTREAAADCVGARDDFDSSIVGAFPVFGKNF